MMTAHSGTKHLVRQPQPVFFLIVMLLGALLLGCAHAVSPDPAQLTIALPETYPLYEGTTPAPDRWWEGFASEELNNLVSEAISANRNLRASLARLEQSSAAALQAGAQRLPDLNLRAAASETRRKAADEVVSDSSRSLTLVSSWEPDFWGQIQARHRAALLEVESSREELYASAITLSAEVTLRWLEIISVRRQLDLYAQQLETNRTILELMELRYLKGLANALDIYQQRQAVAENETGFPQLQARLESLENELAVLCGKMPGGGLEIKADEFPGLKAQPETGIPADILSRRPDVRGAGLDLRAAESQLSAARADRLPSVNISATAGFGSDSLGDLLERWLTTLAANLTWPLLDSGTRKAEVTRRQKIAEEKLAIYEQTVLEALQEVMDAMVSEHRQKEYIEGLRKQLAISRDGFREAVSRYRKGLSDYLPVLGALTSTQRLERSIVQAQLDQFSYRVKLHRALGGGWMSQKFE